MHLGIKLQNRLLNFGPMVENLKAIPNSYMKIDEARVNGRRTAGTAWRLPSLGLQGRFQVRSKSEPGHPRSLIVSA